MCIFAVVPLSVNPQFILYICFMYKSLSSMYIVHAVIFFLAFLFWCMQEKCASVVGQAEDTCGALNSKKPTSSHDLKTSAFTMINNQKCLCCWHTQNFNHLLRETRRFRDFAKFMPAHVAAWLAWCAWSSTVSLCAEWLLTWRQMFILTKE